MFDSFSKSWQLVKASWAVLQSDKELLWFPIMSSIALIVVTLLLLVPTGFVAWSMSASGASEEGMQVVGAIGTFIFYLVSYTVMIYFNTGLVGAAMMRPTLKQNPPPVPRKRVGKSSGK